jgi:hypothetical protein
MSVSWNTQIYYFRFGTEHEKRGNLPGLFKGKCVFPSTGPDASWWNNDGIRDESGELLFSHTELLTPVAAKPSFNAQTQKLSPITPAVSSGTVVEWEVVSLTTEELASVRVALQNNVKRLYKEARERVEVSGFSFTFTGGAAIIVRTDNPTRTVLARAAARAKKRTVPHN